MSDERLDPLFRTRTRNVFTSHKQEQGSWKLGGVFGASRLGAGAIVITGGPEAGAMALGSGVVVCIVVCEGVLRGGWSVLLQCDWGVLSVADGL